MHRPYPLRFACTNLVALGGAASITYGCWLAWEPAGFIVGGGFALVAALLLARLGRRPPEG